MILALLATWRPDVVSLPTYLAVYSINSESPSATEIALKELLSEKFIEDVSISSSPSAISRPIFSTAPALPVFDTVIL